MEEDTYLFPTRYCSVRLFPILQRTNLILQIAFFFGGATIGLFSTMPALGPRECGQPPSGEEGIRGREPECRPSTAGCGGLAEVARRRERRPGAEDGERMRRRRSLRGRRRIMASGEMGGPRSPLWDGASGRLAGREGRAGTRCAGRGRAVPGTARPVRCYGENLGGGWPVPAGALQGKDGTRCGPRRWDSSKRSG